MARRYNGDPYWVTVKNDSKCAQCGKTIKAGDKAFKYKSGELYGLECGCGHVASSDFDCAAEYEDFYNS